MGNWVNEPEAAVFLLRFSSEVASASAGVPSRIEVKAWKLDSPGAEAIGVEGSCVGKGSLASG